MRAHSRRAARNFATSSSRFACALKKKDSRGANSSTARPGGARRLDVGDAVGQRERDLLDGVAAGLADVVAADADGVPARHLRPAEGEDVGDEAHRRRRRIDVRAARDVLLEDVVLDRAGERAARDAALVGDRDVERQQRRRRGVDGHRRRDLAERQAVEQHTHVVDRRDRDAGAPDLAARQRVVGVAAHLRRQIEGDRQPGLPRRQQELVATVGLLRGAEAGVLAHGPEAPAVHGGCTPRVNGNAPGRPRSRAGSNAGARSARSSAS